MQHRIAVIGSGYVGTVAAACFASVDHNVVVVERDPERLAVLEAGRAPFFEPGLDEVLSMGVTSGNLTFTADYDVAMEQSDVVFVCVGTPASIDGHPDLSAVKEVTHSLAKSMKHPHIIVNKSTVPIGTGKWVLSLLREETEPVFPLSELKVVSNPEFLREGSSVRDFLQPDRVVLGSDDPRAIDTVADLYQPLLMRSSQRAGKGLPDPATIVRTTLAAAEMIKYASNAFLATKISFANEMARICDLVGADIKDVTTGMGLDPRIGPKFLDAGLGWGGSCFPKDILALIRTAAEYGYSPRLVQSALDVNDDQRRIVLDALLKHLKVLRGARVGVLGLAFKPNTDDLRDSAAMDVIRMLQARDVVVVANDPTIREVPGIRTVGDPYDVADGADAVVLATAWPQYLSMDLAEVRRRMSGSLFFDGRNVFDPQAVTKAGLTYAGIGRSAGRTENVPLPAEARQWPHRVYAAP